MLDRYLITHCSPTLASLKTANLFRLSYGSERELAHQMGIWGSLLEDKGVTLTLLSRKKGTALIYVCRKGRLQADLRKPGVARFLKGYGYTCTDVNRALARLKERIAAGGGFPHEIGIFLGYPLEDVTGFIHNSGQNCKCAGCWKAYCNAGEARRTFAKYKKCTAIYTRLWREGRRSVRQLTVAA